MGELGADVEVIGEPEEMSFGVEQNLELFERPPGGIQAPSTETLAGSENGYHDEWRWNNANRRSGWYAAGQSGPGSPV